MAKLEAPPVACLQSIQHHEHEVRNRIRWLVGSQRDLAILVEARLNPIASDEPVQRFVARGKLFADLHSAICSLQRSERGMELHRAVKGSRRSRKIIGQLAMKPDLPVAATSFEVMPQK